MPEANSNRNTTTRSTFNPYRERALIRRAILAALADPKASLANPFAGIEDRTGEPVKAWKKTAGFGGVA